MLLNASTASETDHSNVWTNPDSFGPKFKVRKIIKSGFEPPLIC